MGLWVVVGGQYGSEGKGKVSAHITRREDIDICVRCGGPNSGHSLTDSDGNTTIVRQLPTGYVNARTRLLIAAGALVDLTVLKNEIDFLGLPPSRVGVDRNAFIIEPGDKEREKALGLRERLSSTLCGVGSAVSRRALREEGARQAKDAARETPWLAELITDTSEEANRALDSDLGVLIEGTQGFGLSLFHSEHYPRCTSRDTIASGFLSEVGIGPTRATEIVLVFRTFPIRVAGQQAGPLRDEISWEQIREESEYPHEIEERTSVTQKVRRVGRFDWGLARKAINVNRPTMLAINGLDYLSYSNRGVGSWESLSQDAKSFVLRFEVELGAKVRFVGTGPSLREVISFESGVLNASHPLISLG